MWASEITSSSLSEREETDEEENMIDIGNLAEDAWEREEQEELLMLLPRLVCLTGRRGRW